MKFFTTLSSCGFTLEGRVVALTENFAGLTSDGSTQSPRWLPVNGVTWSHHPHHPDTDYVRATVPSTILEAVVAGSVR